MDKLKDNLPPKSQDVMRRCTEARARVIVKKVTLSGLGSDAIKLAILLNEEDFLKVTASGKYLNQELAGKGYRLIVPSQ